MLKKVMNYFNIGSPHVDLVLAKDKWRPGEKVTGVFQVEGGWIRQKIKRLECDFVKELQDGKVETIDAVTTILMSQTMNPNEKTEIPLQYFLPKDLPCTSENITYRFNTRLVFQDDIKRIDHDEVFINQKKTKKSKRKSR
jgi:sporulation-control protein